MKQATEQPIQAAKTAEWLNEAVLAAADYSSKVAARQMAFARKAAARGEDFSRLSQPDAAEAKQAASEYLIFAREAVEDFAQACDRGFSLWERAVDGAAANGRAFLPAPAESFGRQWIDGVKAANAAVKDGVRISCAAAAEGLRPFEANGKTNGAAKSETKTGKK